LNISARQRVIPALLLRRRSFVKTIQFGKWCYVGDPCNTLRIFNELEVDEVFVLDIDATASGKGPDFALLGDIASECFMPLAYGGGINSVEFGQKILGIGYEKVVLSTAAAENPQLVSDLAARFGSQAIVVSIDVRRLGDGRPAVVTRGGARVLRIDPGALAGELVARGAGEVLLTSVDRDGTWQGFDVEMISAVAASVTVPLVARGGCGNLEDIAKALTAGASSVAVGSLVVFQKKGMGVLVNYPAEGISRVIEGF